MLKSFSYAAIAVTVILAVAACSAGAPMGAPASAPTAAPAAMKSASGSAPMGMGTPAAAPAAGQGGSATVGALQISDAWTRPVASGLTGAAYFTVRNTGSTPDRLIKAESDISKAVETHTTVMKDGVMSMQPVDGYDVPANGELILKPGGNHIMFVGTNKDVKVDDTVTLKLQFEKAGPVTVMLKARQP